MHACAAPPLPASLRPSLPLFQATEAGAAQTATSEAATFSTGISYPSGWAGAEWIGASKAADPVHTLLRTPFTVPAGATVDRAVAYAVGLGYYKLHVDGVQVSTHELGAFTT